MPTTIISLRMDDTLLAALDGWAKGEGVSRNESVARMVRLATGTPKAAMVLPPEGSLALRGHKGETVSVEFPLPEDQAAPFLKSDEPITNSCSPEAKEARRVKKVAKKAKRMQECLDALPAKVPARMQGRVMAGKLGEKCPHGYMNNMVCRRNGGGC